MDKNKKDRETCYCCDAIATSKEHIPPKCLFIKPRPSNLITVPSCNQHNLEKSKDDEYFRWFIATASAERSQQARELIDAKIIKAFKRKPALLNKIWQGAIRKVNIYSQGGIYLGDKPGFRFDRMRLQKILDQICKGIFFYHFNRKLGKEYGFRDFVIYPYIDEKMKQLICSLELYDIGDGSIFSYRFLVCSEDPNIVMWFLMFFSHFLIITMSKRNLIISK